MVCLLSNVKVWPSAECGVRTQTRETPSVALRTRTVRNSQPERIVVRTPYSALGAHPPTAGTISRSSSECTASRCPCSRDLVSASDVATTTNSKLGTTKMNCPP
jgi:hypothetical protein